MSIYNLDCREGMAGLIAENSVDAIVTDPPYGLSKHPNMAEVLKHWLAGDDYAASGSGFMGKSWDSFVPGPAIWKEAYRCLKPGGWAVVFAGSRTQDLMSIPLRLAGFEIMDTGMWLYGSGFPKSLNIGKALGEKWDGWGTALKPGYEPFILCRKPLDGTYANNVTTHGVGALNIDGGRVPFADLNDEQTSKKKNQHADFKSGPMTNNIFGEFSKDRENYDPPGRWPANVVTSELDEPWAKYFYNAKASKADRDEGLDDLLTSSSAELTNRTAGSDGMNSPRAGAGRTSGRKNTHPTVKPTKLMRWLCRLVTPPGGLILDPFAGSGSTGKAAVLEGFKFIGFELTEEHAVIAQKRIDHARSINV